MYAAAAASATGALVLAVPAEGKVIYTPVHVILTSIPNSSYALDLNHDGITDFSLLGNYQNGQSETSAYIACEPMASPNMVWGRDFRSALMRGAKVGHGGIFNRKSPRMGWVTHRNTSGSLFSGYWVNGGKGVKNRYLRLKFAIKGNIHYGWARLSVAVKHGRPYITATLTGFAYETVANKPIVTGQKKGPGVERLTLGHLARGAAAPHD